jgi:hypothetical protein
VSDADRLRGNGRQKLDAIQGGVWRRERRESSFPVRDAGPSRRRNDRAGLWLVGLVFLAGFVLFARDILVPAVETFWTEEIGPRLAGVAALSERRVPSPEEAADPRRVPPVVHREELIDALQPPRPVAVELPVSIAAGFRVAGFRAAALAHEIDLAPEPPRGLRLPARYGTAYYGAVALSTERPYRLMLVQEGSARRLYVDRNRNGDLTDDGEALRNEGSGRFAASLKLPLAEVTRGRLEGVYDLWVFLDDRRDDQLHVYSRTQLAGEVSVEGRRIAAILADNAVLDGDYTNDGIALDLDGDRRFDGPRERVGPGETLELGGRSYRFRVGW